MQTSTSRGLSPSILHEAVEAAIEQIASQTVASIVVEVTDDMSLPKAERRRCKSSRLAPRERYIERRGYYNDQPRSGIGFSAPGVSIGVGNGRW